MKIKDVMLFAYDFPHKKTQDFIFRLIIEGYNIKYVIASPWKKLDIPKPAIRLSPANEGLLHPKDICKRFNIKYYVHDHNSSQSISHLAANPVNLCIISGSRILSNKIITAAQNKIINVHPGLLPQVRGLDTLLWSIYYNVPIGITSHFISGNIDKGLLIYREPLKLRKDDTLIDVSLRLLEKQADILSISLNKLKINSFAPLAKLDNVNSGYNKKMSKEMEESIVKKFPAWLKKIRSMI
jgi:methionyl-tRNA formyltransferase